MSQMHLANIRFGPRIRAVGGPVGRLTLPHSVALLGSDFPDLRLDLRVQEGDRVATGEVLFSNRKHPEVVFVAPARGQVKKINLGPGRRLSALILDLEPDEAPGGIAPQTAQTDGDIRHLLLSRGLWPAFRSRPFGRIPTPDARPEAIFVHAMAGYDGAPDPATLLAKCSEMFGEGLNALTGLTEGAVHACIPEDLTLPSSVRDRVRITHFPPRRQLSMATYQIARLHGTTHGRPVWSIGWQDVVAIGHLLMTGHYQGDRIVALQASPAATPELSRTILGASLPDLFGGHPAGSEMSVSGPAIGDKQAHWLGRYDTQAARIVERGGSFIHRVFGRSGSAPRAILPHAALDACLPPGIPVVPFLRALAAGDVDGVERLGGRDMIEEDLMHAQYLCTSGTDYGARLRQMLNMMDAAG